MAKFIIVLCTLVACVAGHPGVVAPLVAARLAYASPLAYSSQLAYSAPLQYAAPIAYNLAHGGSSRIDIQNNYNVAPQFAFPFAADPVALPARIAASVAKIALSAPVALAPPAVAIPPPVAVPAPAVAVPAPVAIVPAPVVAPAPVAVPTPLAATSFIPATLNYNAPLLVGSSHIGFLNNYNAAAYGAPLSYTLPSQYSAVPLAGRLAAAPIQFAAPLTAAPVPVAAPLTAAPAAPVAVAAPLNAAPVAPADSKPVPEKLSESPTPVDDEVSATPAAVDGSSTDSDEVSAVTQSPVAPLGNY